MAEGEVQAFKRMSTLAKMGAKMSGTHVDNKVYKIRYTLNMLHHVTDTD